MATATDDNAEIKNLDARLFKKSTCWYTRKSNWLYPDYADKLALNLSGDI